MDSKASELCQCESSAGGEELLVAVGYTRSFQRPKGRGQRGRWPIPFQCSGSFTAVGWLSSMKEPNNAGKTRPPRKLIGRGVRCLELSGHGNGSAESPVGRAPVAGRGWRTSSLRHQTKPGQLPLQISSTISAFLPRSLWGAGRAKQTDRGP